MNIRRKKHNDGDDSGSIEHRLEAWVRIGAGIATIIATLWGVWGHGR